MNVGAAKIRKWIYLAVIMAIVAFALVCTIWVWVKYASFKAVLMAILFCASGMGFSGLGHGSNVEIIAMNITFFAAIMLYIIIHFLYLREQINLHNVGKRAKFPTVGLVVFVILTSLSFVLSIFCLRYAFVWVIMQSSPISNAFNAGLLGLILAVATLLTSMVFGLVMLKISSRDKPVTQTD